MLFKQTLAFQALQGRTGLLWLTSAQHPTTGRKRGFHTPTSETGHRSLAVSVAPCEGAGAGFLFLCWSERRACGCLVTPTWVSAETPLALGTSVGPFLCPLLI